MGFALLNPGNIRNGAATFKGEFKPSRDLHFRQFETMQMGIRAISVILLNYYEEEEIDTIRGIISRWAPPSDNNPTAAYIDNVAEVCGFDPDDTLDMHSPDTHQGIVTGIIQQENGSLGDITLADISSAIALALKTV